MANEDTALREVDQELAEDKQWAMFRKYGPTAIAAGIAIVIGVAGWQLWSMRAAAIAEQEALEFRNSLELLEEDEAAGQAELAALAGEQSTGYAVLAQFHRAASLVRGSSRGRSTLRESYPSRGCT